MGNNKSRIRPMNDECPICFESSQSNIILNCGHMFDYYCIQKHFSSFFLDGKAPTCPLCRKLVSINDFNKVFKNLQVDDIVPNQWINYNTFNVSKKIKIDKLNRISKDNYDIIIPTYKVNLITMPVFFILENVEFIHEDFENELSNYNVKLIGILENKNPWYKFTKYNALDKIMLKSSNRLHNPNDCIDLYVKNINNIVVYNERYGTFTKNLDLIYTQKATVLFRTYIVEYKTNLFFINELHGILYKN